MRDGVGRDLFPTCLSSVSSTSRLGPGGGEAYRAQAAFSSREKAKRERAGAPASLLTLEWEAAVESPREARPAGASLPKEGVLGPAPSPRAPSTAASQGPQPSLDACFAFPCTASSSSSSCNFHHPLPHLAHFPASPHPQVLFSLTPPWHAPSTPCGFCFSTDSRFAGEQRPRSPHFRSLLMHRHSKLCASPLQWLIPLNHSVPFRLP